MPPTLLKVAFTLADEVTLSDFIGPCELLSGINHADNPTLASQFGHVPVRVAFDFLAPTLDPVVPVFTALGPKIVPTKTYDDALKEGLQYDILWVPAGPSTDSLTGASRIPRSQIEFIKAQAPKAKYIMSVCAGSAILAEAGILEGKRATTNKFMFRSIVATSSKNIDWIAQARWVVDGNIWTSSGVTAGTDMAMAFIEHLVGTKVADIIRGRDEVIVHNQDDDPFAEVHGLVNTK